jgi:hypothetical protein
MTSQLNVDTIVDKAGSGGSNVKMANTSTYVSEGGAKTQNTVQGLCKVWVHYNGDSNHAIQDSFNVTSVADGGTGRGTVSIANDMNNNSYNLQYTDSCPDSPAINGLYIHTFQTGAYSLASVNNSGGYTDGLDVCSAVFGDLA